MTDQPVLPGMPEPALQATEPPTLNRAYFDANITALEETTRQKYLEWQQALGALNILRQLRALAPE